MSDRPACVAAKAAVPPASLGALLAHGSIRHARSSPVAHAFDYPTAFLLLPMRRLAARPEPALQRNRRALLSFHDADHGDGGPDALAWFDGLLARRGLAAPGEVWLQTFPRVLGFAFKPVSFWYGFGLDGALAVVVAEVHNTFGDRHSYVLHGEGLAFGRTQRAAKRFHVSPFFDVEGHYLFRFLLSQGGSAPDGLRAVAGDGLRAVAQDGLRAVARVELHREGTCVLRTSMSGEGLPLTRRRVWATLARMPLLTLGVVARIHWQALRLWLQHVPFHRRPEPVTPAITMGEPAQVEKRIAAP